MSEQNYNLDFTQKFQQQFEFYFTGLVFTLLGLAVQTGKPTHHIWASYFEFGGWVSLMACGFVSLHRLWMVPTLIKMQVELTEIILILGQLNVDITNGHSPNTPVTSENDTHLTLAQAIEQHTQLKKSIEVKVKKSQAMNIFKGRICMGTFLLALLFLIISRSTGLFLDCNPAL